MEYTLEISFDISKYTNVTNMKNNIITLASNYNSTQVYSMYDMECKGRHNIYRNHCILIVTFTEEDIINCVKFIKQIKKYKSYTIECIYKSSGSYRLIYATLSYLKTLNKDQSNTYIASKSTTYYTYNEYLLLNELFSKSLLSDILNIAGNRWGGLDIPNTI